MFETHSGRYHVDLPYPPVEAGAKNPVYANAMLSNVGGSNSEMSAVSLYFYNHLIIEAQYGEFSDAFEQISIIEMRHLEIFGKLALQLGADPRLWAKQNNRRVYWTPAYNRYPREIRALIGNSLEAEKSAIRKYNKQIECVLDANIVENLKRIILDEQLHVEIFEEMLSLL
ncbi:MAG: ferritin family protein [Bacillota bacterium]